MPQSLNAVVAIILFIIPGFITDRIIALTIPRAKRDSTEIILTALHLAASIMRYSPGLFC